MYLVKIGNRNGSQIFSIIEKCGFGTPNPGVKMLSIPIRDPFWVPNLPDPLECASYTKYF